VEEWWPPAPRWPALLACDHASARVPRRLAGLGLSPAELGRHIALDLGAADLTRLLARELGLPAVLAGYSRLVVDCNRHLHDPTAFAAVSDGTSVPGNAAVGPAERAARAAALHEPYHAAIGEALARLGPAPALIGIHSFTPEMGGVPRPWHAGVLWDRDARLAGPLLRHLRANSPWLVGDNEPYSGRHPAGYTMDRHAEPGRLPHVTVEVRQDLLATTAGVGAAAALLATALRSILDGQFRA
jgi:predicted N-formylglutamate amidohydrolase